MAAKIVGVWRGEGTPRAPQDTRYLLDLMEDEPGEFMLRVVDEDGSPMTCGCILTVTPRGIIVHEGLARDLGIRVGDNGCAALEEC